jgi:hypothetical protein
MEKCSFYEPKDESLQSSSSEEIESGDKYFEHSQRESEIEMQVV